MTDSKKRFSLSRQILIGADGGLTIEIKKTKLGAVAVLSGVLSIDELTDTDILALTHYGRIHFFGEGLTVSVFSDRCLEVIGKVLEVRFSYGKA